MIAGFSRIFETGVHNSSLVRLLLACHLRWLSNSLQMLSFSWEQTAAVLFPCITPMGTWKKYRKKVENCEVHPLYVFNLTTVILLCKIGSRVCKILQLLETTSTPLLTKQLRIDIICRRYRFINTIIMFT